MKKRIPVFIFLVLLVVSVIITINEHQSAPSCPVLEQAATDGQLSLFLKMVKFECKR